MGSFWNDFLDNVTPDSWDTVTTGLGTGIQAVSDVADKVIPDQYESVPSISGNKVTMVPDTSRPNVAGTVFSAATAMVAKPVEAASAAMVKAETYGFGRPISTGAQVFDRNNPLYQDGVQFSDLVSMWDASQNDALTGNDGTNPGISGGQSAWSSILYGIKSGDVGSVLSYFGPSGPPMLAANLFDRVVNPDAVHGTASPADKAASPFNLYDPVKQKKLYNDTTFALLSGMSDTALQIYGLGKMGDSLAGNAKKAIGLDTMIDSARDVNKVGEKMMDHLLFTETSGERGKWNVYGYYLQKAADSNSSADIATNPLFKGSPKAVELGSMLENVHDPITVAKVWAADHGDVRAIGALLRDDPDFAWRMTDGNFKVQMQAVIGDLPVIDRSNAKMVSSVYDRTLERPGNEFYASARDLFLGKTTVQQVDDGTALVEDLGKINSTTLNSRSKPMGNRVAVKVTEGRQNAAMGRSAIPDGDGWVSTVLGKIGGNEPTTVAVQWLGARRPSGTVNLSGLVPTDMVDEALNSIGRLPFMRGQREFSFERDGQSVLMSGEQYRQDAYSRLAYASRRGETAVRNELAATETELISAVVRQFGLSPEDAKSVAELALKGRDSSIMAATDTGFFFDSSANRVMLHPQTQRQLTDSYVMFPIEEFAREARMVMRGTQGKSSVLLKGRHMADLMYELIQKYVRTEQLIRPSYMKNSLIEPVGARLAYEGVSELAPLSRDFAKGAGNWMVNRVRAQGGHAYWVGDKLKLTKGSRMSREAFRIHNERLGAESQLDMLVAARDAAKTGSGFTPAHVDYINRYTDGAIKNAKARLSELWTQADVADPGWHTTQQAPTFSELSAEVNYLAKRVNDPDAVAKIEAGIAKLDSASTPAQAARLADLQAERARIAAIQADPLLVARVSALADDLGAAARARLAMTDGVVSPGDALARVQAQMDALDRRLAALNVRQSSDRLRRERFAKRSTQTDGKMSIKIGDTTLTGDKLLAEKNFGEAKKNEFSADYTNRATFDPGQTSIANAQVLSMAHDSVTVPPSSPRYWDEHAYVMNRHIVGDEYATMILQGKSNTKILAWFDTPGGQSYLKRMDWDRADLLPKNVATVDNAAIGARKRGNDVKGIASDRPVPVWDSGQINTFRRELNHALPTQAARDAVLDGPVTAGQMQKLMSEVPEGSLVPVQGRQLQLAKTGNLGTRKLTRALDYAWKKLASDPENFISRWPFAGKLFQNELQQRLMMLAEQGIKPGPAQWNALQDSVTKFVLSESKKTFYNISHYSNPVYAARYLFVYPQAVFNTMWRAARLTYRNPGSAMVMNEAWTQFFSTNAVDENGDVTTDYNKAKTVSITVPKAVSDAIGSDPQVNFPVNAMNLLSSKLGANWTVTLPLQTLLLHKPEMATMLKRAMGPMFETAFPFGIPSNLDGYTVAGIPVGNWVPNYLKSAFAALQWDDDSFMRVASQQHAYDLAVWSGKVQRGEPAGKRPTVESSTASATKFWVATAIAQANIPGGGGLRTAGSLERDAIRVILNKYNGDREAALPEIQQAFPNLDPSPLMESTSQYSTYVPPTQEAFALISDPALEPLFNQLAQEKSSDMAELLVADKQGEFDANIYDKFGSMSIPGSSDSIRKRASTAEVDARVQASKSWDVYSANKNMIMAEVTRRGLKQMPAAMQQVWNAWTDDFRSRPENAAWSREQGQRDGNKAFSAFNVLKDGLSAPEMEKYRGTAYWQAAQKYVDNFPVILDAYRKASSPDMRAGIAQVWDMYVNQSIGVMDPTFQRMYDKYFAGVDVEM
jgi:hypothetical protein